MKVALLTTALGVLAVAFVFIQFLSNAGVKNASLIVVGSGLVAGSAVVLLGKS